MLPISCNSHELLFISGARLTFTHDVVYLMSAYAPMAKKHDSSGLLICDYRCLRIGFLAALVINVVVPDIKSSCIWYSTNFGGSKPKGHRFGRQRIVKWADAHLIRGRAGDVVDFHPAKFLYTNQ